MSEEYSPDQAPVPGIREDDAEPRASVIKGDQGLQMAQVWLSAFLIVVAGIIAYSNSFTIPPASGAAPSWIHGIAAAHAVTLAVHIGSGILLFLLCRRLFEFSLREPVSMLAGMIFVLHPVATQTVNAIENPATTFAAFFILASIVLYLHSAAAKDHSAYVAMGVGVLSFGLAWASSPWAYVVPPLLLAADWVLSGPGGVRSHLKLQAPYWALAGFMVAGRISETPASSHSNLLEQGWAYFTHLYLAFTAQGMSVAHPLSPPPDSGMLLGIAGLLLAAAVAASGLFLLWRRSVLGFGLLWLGAALAPAAWITEGGATVSEMRIYLAIPGLALVIPWFFHAVFKSGITQKAWTIAMVVLIFASGAGTFLRNSVWNQPLLLWQQAAIIAPELAEVHQRLGELYMAQGDAILRSAAAAGDTIDAATRELEQAQAKEEYQLASENLAKAASLETADPEVQYQLGLSLESQGRRDEAIAAFQEVLRRDAGHQSATLHTAALLQQAGNEQPGGDATLQSFDYYRRAIALGPLPPAFSGAYGTLLAGLGDFPDALPRLKTAEEATPGGPWTQSITDVHGYMESIQLLEKKAAQASSQRPPQPEAVLLHAQALCLQRDYLAAAYRLDQYLKTRPVDMAGWLYLGLARGATDATAHFIARHSPPPVPMSGQGQAWTQLAQLCAASGYWDVAAQYINHAAEEGDLRIPMLAMGEVALSLSQTRRAYDYMRQAADNNPTSPEPWLRLADLAISSKDFTTARGYLKEAEERGAGPQALESRRSQLEEAAPPVTVIR